MDKQEAEAGSPNKKAYCLAQLPDFSPFSDLESGWVPRKDNGEYVVIRPALPKRDLQPLTWLPELTRWAHEQSSHNG